MPTRVRRATTLAAAVVVVLCFADCLSLPLPPSGSIVLTPAALLFMPTVGGGNPDDQVVEVTAGSGPPGKLAIGNATYTNTAGWLTTQLTAANAPSQLRFSVNVAGRAVGTYTAMIPLLGVAAANSPQSVLVTLVVATATPAQLAVAQQPVGGGNVNGSLLTVQPIVEIHDVNGARVASSNNLVTVRIGTGTSVLSGTMAVHAVDGVATFTDLKVSVGTGPYTLLFSSTSLTTASSNAIALPAP